MREMKSDSHQGEDDKHPSCSGEDLNRRSDNKLGCDLENEIAAFHHRGGILEGERGG